MKKIVIGFVLTAIMVGCVQDINDLTFEVIKPGISLPIGSFSIEANSLTKLGDSLQVREGEFNVIEFFYNTELLRSPLNDRFTIADQSFSDAIPFNAFVFVAGATNEVKVSEFNSFTISNVDLPTPVPEMTKLIFKGGTISVSQSKDFDHNVETVIKIPKLTKNGVPLSITLSNTMSVNEPLNLYEFDLTGPLGTSFNTIEYEISTTIRNTGTSTTGTLSLGFDMSSMLFSYVEGDFQTYPFDLFEGNFNLGLPSSNNIPDNIAFTNPSVELVIDNSAGIEFGLDIVEVSVTDADGIKSLITGTYDDQTIILQGASSPSTVATSSYSISNQNTDNFASLLSSIPSSAFFSGNASANPNGIPPQGNFITDSSEVVINANLTLPMEGYANNYALIDTLNNINLKLDKSGKVSIDEVNLRLQIENNFPFEIRTQLYFLDSANQQLVLDSLFTTVDEQRIFTSATVDGTGLVTSSSIETVDINIQNEKYERIKTTGSIKLVVYVLTSGANDSPSKSVKITTDNFLKLDIGLSATALIDPEKLL
ncbi:MAG: hypothetical protein OEX22_03095 [Cyclobacteriaceae bacterium]|nr:hypothetical protein [Cyclobacteriaceae bacterium]